jgi:hypothetical protein
MIDLCLRFGPQARSMTGTNLAKHTTEEYTSSAGSEQSGRKRRRAKKKFNKVSSFVRLVLDID